MEGNHTTIEYMPNICCCGKELSSLFYFLTAQRSFSEFAQEFKLTEKDTSNMGFSVLSNDLITENGLILCCLKTLRYGITSPISAFQHNEVVFQVKGDVKFGRKYPEALPGPLSNSETLSWF